MKSLSASKVKRMLGEQRYAEFIKEYQAMGGKRGVKKVITQEERELAQFFKKNGLEATKTLTASRGLDFKETKIRSIIRRVALEEFLK